MTEIFIPASSGGPLLTYALQVHPDPLCAGAAVQLNLAVSNASDDRIICQSIQLTLQVGDDATDLIDGSATTTAEPAPGWTKQTDGGVVTFTAPAGGAVVTAHSLLFAIATRVNGQAGTSSLVLSETASDDGGPQQVGGGSFNLDKFPADFSLSDLTSVPYDKVDVAHGEPAMLTWIATGAGVSCTLEYQPADEDRQVSVDVPNIPDGGSYRTENLTHGDSVTFTLTAKVNVLGRDNPLIRQTQHLVTVKTMSIAVAALPPRVGVNGLVMLQWDAPNADHCLFEDGTMLGTTGIRYAVMAASHTYTVTAVGADRRLLPGQAIVTVDPSIQPTEEGYTCTGLVGATGHDGYFEVGWAGNGGTGSDAHLAPSLAPLDQTGNATRVIPVTVTGGAGGPGGHGYGSQPGIGGQGGNASLTATFDPSLGPPAQYIITLKVGPGGLAGLGGDPGTPGDTGSPGSPGTSVSATIDGQTVHFA